MTARSHTIRRLAAVVPAIAALLTNTSPANAAPGTPQATRHATPSATPHATRHATPSATPQATRHATPSATPSATPPGTWGAGHYPYLDGRVCTSKAGDRNLTTPLTSWDLGAGRAPGFLTSTVTSDGSVDSAAPPLPSVGTQSVSAVTAGTTGFASDSEIATYAALIGMFGSSGPDRTAQVADAVIRKASGGPPGCVGPAGEAGLLRQAANLAGPYTLTFVAQPPNLLPGTAAPVSARLTSAAGSPVPGATVTFTSRSAQLSALTAITNAAGIATVQVRAPVGTRAESLPIMAHTALPTALDKVTAEGSPTSTDPSGSVATAIVAAPPSTVTGRGNLTVNRSAHPVLRLSLPDQALQLGAATDPRATITGMYGHTATVAFTILGPASISRNSLCANRTRRDFGSAVAATSTLTITGDSTTAAGRWQPTQPGCYWVTARLTTLDATPKVTVRANAYGPITVLDTSVALETSHTLVRSAEAVTGGAVLHHGNGLGGNLHVVLRGPVQPPATASTCAAVDFSSAPVASTSTGELPRDASPSTAGFSIRAGGTGCYELSGAALVHLPKGVTMRVPVAPAAEPRLLAVKPSVSYAMNQVSSVQRGQVSAQVTVIGTFNQPVHVALQMKRAPDAGLPCRGAKYSGATSGPTGPAVAARTNLATVAVRSAPLGEPGCYEPVPVLTMDGNPAITATGSFDALTSTVAVGADPHGHRSIDGRASAPGLSDTRREMAALAAFLLLCLVAFGYAICAAWRTRHLVLRKREKRLYLG